MNQSSVQKYINVMQKWFDQLPSLPTNARDVIVKVTPILAVIFGILGILGEVSALSAMTASGLFMIPRGIYGMGYLGYNYLSMILWLIGDILLLSAYWGTKQRKISGWNKLFWSEVLYFLGSIFSFELIPGLIGVVIAFYFLFQIKSYYK